MPPVSRTCIPLFLLTMILVLDQQSTALLQQNISASLNGVCQHDVYVLQIFEPLARQKESFFIEFPKGGLQ